MPGATTVQTDWPRLHVIGGFLSFSPRPKKQQGEATGEVLGIHSLLDLLNCYIYSMESTEVNIAGQARAENPNHNSPTTAASDKRAKKKVMPGKKAAGKGPGGKSEAPSQGGPASRTNRGPPRVCVLCKSKGHWT